MINCSPYFWNELYLLKSVKAILVLGKFAFDSYLYLAREMGYDLPKMVFKHGAKFELEGLPTLYASYHPSPQNTNTGKLTQSMFRKLLKKIREEQEKK